MQYFHFRRLIEKYSNNFVAELPSEVYWHEGEQIKGEPKRVKLRGAILSHRETKIFRSEGTLTAHDKALYMLEPLENALQLAKIIYRGNVYSIGDLLENSEFTGVWAYTLKYVSAFKETAPYYDITDELNDLEERLDGVLETTEEEQTNSELDLDALEKRLSGE